MLNCAPTAVAAYVPSPQMPWNRTRAVHLHRRMTFGANVNTVNAAVATDPLRVVDDLIATAKALPLRPEPDFAFQTQDEYGLALLESTLQKDGFAREWILALQQDGLRGRMELFWHNHFVTRFDVYESAGYTYQYHKLLQEYALGDFREFVRKIGLTPAMLVFLNGNQNAAGSPNENYAREVYELFTLGDNNGYTQEDIEETARALTGYTNVTEAWGPIEFDPATHDDGTKTIFGRTGNWGYDDVIDLLFTERPVQVSEFIAGKLYRRFVNPEVDPGTVTYLAGVFRDSDWDIAELLRALFQNTHFYDEKNMATIIEGPLESVLMFYNELDVTMNGLTVLGVYAETTTAGQALFNPVDVAGWPGNRSWINTTSITDRWKFYESQLGIILVFGFGTMGAIARAITDEENDVDLICQDLLRYFLPRGVQFDGVYAEALLTFKGNVPPAFFENGNWDINYWALPSQFYALLVFLTQLPEYQLK